MPRNPHSSRASTSHPNRDISLTREKERDTNLRYQIRSKGTGLSLFTTSQQSHQDKNLIPAFPIVEKLDLYFPFGYKYKRAFETHWPRDKETFQQNNRAWLRESDGELGGETCRCVLERVTRMRPLCEFTKEITFGLEARNWSFQRKTFSWRMVNGRRGIILCVWIFEKIIVLEYRVNFRKGFEGYFERYVRSRIEKMLLEGRGR